MKHLAFNIFKASIPEAKLAKGKILIADPFLKGAYFSRSIILLTEYSEDGAVGFVLNKASNIYPDEVIDDLLSFKGELYIGGPVASDTLHFLHTLGDKIPGSVQVSDKIFWGGDFDKVKELINEKKANAQQIKFFAGYSGWSPGQLEKEIEDKSWIVAELKDNIIISSDTKNIWKNSLQSLGGMFEVWSGFPEEPSHN